jgi:hypothetical protein
MELCDGPRSEKERQTRRGEFVLRAAANRPIIRSAGSRQEDPDMTLEFTVGINVAGEAQSVTVSAEDALIAALMVKHETPEAIINYVRRRNRRGDRRHPHKSIAAR